MKKILSKTLVTCLVLQALYLASPSIAQAEEMTCPPPVPVVIDIRPGDQVTRINPSVKGLLPVAVLATEDFDASLFRPEMAHLGTGGMTMGCEGAEAVRWAYSDANHDGRVDLVIFFRIQDLSLTPGSSTTVMLMAHGTYNTMMIHIMGTESVIVKP